MRTLRLLFFQVIPALILLSCSGVKQSMRDAEVFTNEGLYQKAFEEYHSVYLKKEDAFSFVGMNRSAEALQQEKIDDFRNAQSLRNYEQALDILSELEGMQREFGRQGLSLTDIDTDALEDQVRSAWANDCVARVQGLLSAGDFKSADKWIRQLQAINRSDPRIEGLWTLSSVVEQYQLGKEYLELGLNKQAYLAFEEVVKRDASFGDALHKRDSVRNTLSYTLACIVLDNPEVPDDVEKITVSSIQKELLQELESYVSLLDRTELEVLLEEQRQNMGAAFDAEQAIEAGQLAGAEYILSGKFVSYDLGVNNELVDRRYAVKGRTGATSQRVAYDYYSAEWKQEVVFAWSLADSRTGKIYRSGNIPYSQKGETDYARFDGDHKDLYEVDPFLGMFHTPWNKRKKDLSSREKFLKLFEENFEQVPDEADLEVEVFSEIAKSIAQNIKDFSPKTRN